MNLNLDYDVVRVRHIDDKWYYLYKMFENYYCIVVYANDENIILFSTLEFSEGSAIRLYNKIKKNPSEYL